MQVCPVRCRVFGDADNPDDPVARALAGNRHVYVVPPDFDAKPTLAYLNGTTPTDWLHPRRKPRPVGDVPPALAEMAREKGVKIVHPSAATSLSCSCVA